jgi:hypothetical protein
LSESVVGRILWLAVEDAGFRARLLLGPGNALAEEGFVLNDDEMSTLRDCFESLNHLTERRAFERINAMARGYHRELSDFQ